MSNKDQQLKKRSQTRIQVRIKVIGTSHISPNSIKELESTFRDYDPGIVAVELDKNRLYALLHNKKPDYSPRLIRSLGIKGYLFALIGSIIQQKLGRIIGARPGADMLRAVQLARDQHKRIALVDRDIRITLSRLSRAITLKEKTNFLIDLFRVPFSKKMKINLSSVPEGRIIENSLGMLKKRYPGLYRVLVDERNRIMVLKLRTIMENYPEQKILVVVGAGHKRYLEKKLSKKGV